MGRADLGGAHDGRAEGRASPRRVTDTFCSVAWSGSAFPKRNRPRRFVGV